jgi:hypothetical protein
MVTTIGFQLRLRGNGFCTPFHRSTEKMASDGQENGKTDSVDTGTDLTEINKLMEKEEPSIDMLQWYLRMIIDSEEDPKPKK